MARSDRELVMNYKPKHTAFLSNPYASSESNKLKSQRRITPVSLFDYTAKRNSSIEHLRATKGIIAGYETEWNMFLPPSKITPENVFLISRILLKWK